MTASSHKPRIDRRVQLTRDRNEDIATACEDALPDFDTVERKENQKPLEENDALVLHDLETKVILERCAGTQHWSVASILNTVIGRAQDGDLQAAKFLLDRVLPDPRNRLINFDLREINSASDVASAWGDVFAAVSQGKITLKEAQAFGGLLKNYIDTTAALSNDKPRLADKNVALFFVTENEAEFLSIDGSDQELYTVFRKDNESEPDFQKRAEAEMRQKFPKTEAVVYSHAQYLIMFPEGERENISMRDGESKSSRRFRQKIREKAVALRAASAKKSEVSD